MDFVIPFEEFEKAVMTKIMEQDTSINLILRQQYQNASVMSRDFTGAGFFTDFSIPHNIPRIIEPVPYAYGDVGAIINDIYGYGFILFIENGVFSFLEGYTWEDKWPEQIQTYRLIHETINRQ